MLEALVYDVEFLFTKDDLIDSKVRDLSLRLFSEFDVWRM